MATRPSKKSKVPLYGNPNKTAFVEDGATAGATLGLDLWMPDGTLATAAKLAAYIGAIAASSGGSGIGGLSRTLWSLIGEIPPNVTEVAELATAGLVVRQTSGDWITRAITVASTDRLTIADGDGDAGAPTLDMADVEALSVWGNAGSSTAKPDAITGTANQVLRVNSAGTALAFGQVNLASSAAITGRLPFANLAQGAATSVLGVSGGATADVASIAAAADDRLLARTSGALAFTQLTAGMFPNAVVPDAALSSNVPLLNVVNNFQAAQFVTGIATDAQGFAVVGPGGSLRVYPWSSGEVEVLARDAANSAYVGLGIYADSISLSPNSGGLGAVVLAGVAASDFARLSQSNTFTANQTISKTGPVLIVRDTAGSASAMTAYVSLQDNSFERGWIGFGEGNTLMRVVNNIGALVLQSTQLFVVSQESRLIDDAAFLSFYNSGNTTRSGYLQMNAGGNAIVKNDVSGGALLLITNGGSVQVSGASETRLVADSAYLSFYNDGNTTRRGYLQMITGAGAVLNSEESARDLLLVVNAGRILFSLDSGSSSTAAFSSSGALQVTGAFGGGFLAAQGVEIGVSTGFGYVQSYDRNASAYKHLYLSGDEVYVTKSGGTALVVATQDSGSFTGTLSGFSSTVSGTFEWRRTGNKVTIYRSSVLSGNSNAAGTKTLSGVPAAIQPSVAQRGYALVLTNSNVSTDGNAQISGGNITFSASNGGGFVGSGTEGIAGGFSLTYDLT